MPNPRRAQEIRVCSGPEKADGRWGAAPLPGVPWRIFPPKPSHVTGIRAVRSGSFRMTQFKESGPGRVLASLWRWGVRSWLRRVEFVIACRDLERPPYEIPTRYRPEYDESERFMHDTGLDALPTLSRQFDPRRLEHLRRCIERRDIDVQSRIDEDGTVWCYIMHGLKPMQDLEYGFAVPLREGHDVYIFDGWVHPEHRGRMVALLAQNDYHELRRGQGYRRAYVALRTQDVRSRRLHQRMDYVEVGRIRHTKVGPFRFNRVEFRPGLHPTEDPIGPVPAPSDSPVV